MKKINRTGEIRVNNQGLKMTIVEYRDAIDIDVEFEDGFVFKNAIYGNFKKGVIKNPYFPEVLDVGFVGVGRYNAYENGKLTKLYDTWHSMLKRCYDERQQERRPTYKGCSVCEEWHNYQNFAKWYEENLWNTDCNVLDKDILIKGNKIYSPQTCMLVDNRINTLFVKKDKNRGDYPIGVNYRKDVKNFQARCNIIIDGKNQRKHLGSYNTPLEAFKAYKTFKELYVKQVADEYKEKYPNFPQQLYTSIYKYEVEITD